AKPFAPACRNPSEHRVILSSFFRLVPNPIRRRLGDIARIVPKVLLKVEGLHVAFDEEHGRNGLLGEVFGIESRYLATGVMPRMKKEAFRHLTRKSWHVVHQDMARRF